MTKIIQLVDKVAVGFSLVCACHCVLMPIAVVMFPILISTPLADEHYHQLMLWLVLPTSIFALGMGCHRHRNLNVLMFGIIGISILTFSAFFGHDILGHKWERVFTLVGGLVLALGHIKNHNMCREDCCHGHEHDH